MRFRAGLVFVFLAVWLGLGCRKPTTPTVDSNVPPETWITAAPQDTLTTRDENGTLIPPQPGTIPFRYHLYWSGSDQDGAVAGFYWAVTETVGSVSGLPVPPLPGPKPRDYHYTTKRDSTFIFSVFEETNGRQHAFYIYAVDEKGKPDPTPARLIFNSLDRFPPIPIIDPESNATGRIFRPNDTWNGTGSIPAQIETTIALRDTFSRRSTVSDIVPMNSVVTMRWHSELTTPNNPAVFYKYKIGEGNEVEFVTVPASVTGTEYNTTDQNRLGPGLKIFTLRAIDQAGGARTSPETTRRFYMNLLPDTWFSGPDTNQSIYTVVRHANGQVKERYYQTGLGGTANWTTPIPGSLLGPDSVKILPSQRPARKTFFEIYSEYNFANPSQNRHRIYAHAEGDTVHLNSWVLLFGGGFDADSPYSLRVLIDSPFPPEVRGSTVLTSGPANGSPIGQRYRIPVLLDSIGPIRAPGSGTQVSFPQSQVYPLSDPAFGPEPHIGGYQGVQQSGRAYALLRSQDGNGGLDERIGDPIAFVDSIEAGLISPSNPRYALRDKVITFFINRAPYLTNVDDQNPATRFQPYQGQQFFTRTIPVTLNKSADDDPFQNTIQRSIGGFDPTKSEKILRFSVIFRGRRTGSNPARDTVYAPVVLARKTGVEIVHNIEVPSFIQGPEVAVEIEICDCRDCENVPGQGRCRRYPPIRVTVPAVSPQEIAAAAASLKSSTAGPGSTAASSRSRTP
jgi:hypothetical protein